MHADIVFVSNIASGIEGWYIERLVPGIGIFWNAATFTPLMMLCVLSRRSPGSRHADSRSSWRGFAYFSAGLTLIYGALDQGQRLYWFNSGTIAAMTVAGIFLVAASLGRRIIQPNPTLNLSFLEQAQQHHPCLIHFRVQKFEHLATVVLVPAFLGNIQGYRPLETGHALAWVALPMLAVVWLVAILIVHLNSRLVLTFGLSTAGVACWYCAHLDSSWAGTSFQIVELVLAVGFACTYIGLVSSIVLEGIEAGALASVANAATFSGFMHFIRLFGGPSR